MVKLITICTLLGLALLASQDGKAATSLESRFSRIGHHVAKLSKEAPRAITSRKAWQQFEQHLAALKRQSTCTAAHASAKTKAKTKAKARNLRRHAAKRVLRSIRGLDRAASQLGPKAKRKWLTASGSKRLTRLSRLIKPLVNLSFRRVGNCLEGRSADARLSDRMVVI